MLLVFALPKASATDGDAGVVVALTENDGMGMLDDNEEDSRAPTEAGDVTCK